MRVENQQDFYDLASVVAVTKTYCTIEPFIDAKCDVHIQKIGNNLKAYARKSISGNWKANVGSAVLEQINVNERYKKWIEDVSEAFGGLDICAVELIVGKDGKEHIIEVTGSAMTLLGESQEEDRRAIADLVVQRMQYICRPAFGKRPSIPTGYGSTEEQPSDGPQSQAQMAGRVGPTGQQPTNPTPQRPPQRQPSQPVALQAGPQTQRRGSKDQNEINSTSGVTNPFSHQNAGNVGVNQTPVVDNQQNVNQNQSQNRPTLFRRTSQTGNEEPKGDEGEDTMRNLRKTFAGIFGDM
ncbi:unnamed protein product [Medioppia subpectinata]|uniref:Synapsin ATP-binding domain-containing protein n=1 Tax=Medioppia subpectinata TaxID=1979941 RepID=A0A7R9L3I1_9ACAR|nr:unnamed protein product [Medioppia subpectinata]CAG2113658.1 unnamed protein product [Medioppia subpectinata]